MFEPRLVRIMETMIVNTRIKPGPFPAKIGANTPLIQGTTPVPSLVTALESGSVTAHMRMTSQLMAVFLTSLNTMQGCPSPSPLGRMSRMAAQMQ